MTVLNMDCIEGMRLFPDAFFDSIVTDPPYELTSARPGGRSPATEGKVMKGFMGMEWDGSGIAYNVEMWREALRVLKPGGHLLAFSGSRTYHRMVCAIEDAGFEIRDQIMWVYGSGFPKSLDVSKAIDKAAGAERTEVVGSWKPTGNAALVGGQGSATAGRGNDGTLERRESIDILAPATDAARQWQGWGTALKPAHEPIVVARKPLIGTVAANVLAHGTGAINVDGCRVGYQSEADMRKETRGVHAAGAYQHAAGDAFKKESNPVAAVNDLGRWPANLIHDGSDEVVAAFPQAPGQQGIAKTDGSPQGNKVYGALKHGTKQPEPRVEFDKSAARFFYCAKASKSDRGEGNVHPTVKPTDLMRYLVRLVTPPGGTVLDPFTGSGSTGRAAMLEGFAFIGFELSEEYTRIALARMNT